MTDTAKQLPIRRSNKPKAHTEDEVEQALTTLAAQNPDSDVYGEITPRGTVRLHIDQPGTSRRVVVESHPAP